MLTYSVGWRHLKPVFCGILLVLMTVYSTHVDIDDEYFLGTQIITKEQLPSGAECLDSAGNIIGHNGTWTANDTCEKNRCFHGYTDKFVIKNVCRMPLESENPDPENCNLVEDSSSEYPHCCPVIECPGDQIFTTTAVPDCIDRSSNYSCYIWSTYFNGCDPGSDTYNYTLVYCRSTCQWC